MQSSEAKLILPNHQSHVDPMLIAVIIEKYCDFVPVVSENYLKIPIIKYCLKSWNAIAVSDLSAGSKDTDVLKKISSQVQDALNKRMSVILYPSGQITRTPIEKIYNKQSAYKIVSNLPENTKVIGVRISGLWGSMWSVAWIGKQPNFVLTFLKGIFYFFANFIFFLPKRTVTFEFVNITEEARLKAMMNRGAFNSFMGEFYNVNGPEIATYIKHVFYLPEFDRKYPIT